MLTLKIKFNHVSAAGCCHGTVFAVLTGSLTWCKASPTICKAAKQAWRSTSESLLWVLPREVCSVWKLPRIYPSTRRAQSKHAFMAGPHVANTIAHHVMLVQLDIAGCCELSLQHQAAVSHPILRNVTLYYPISPYATLYYPISP